MSLRTLTCACALLAAAALRLAAAEPSAPSPYGGRTKAAAPAAGWFRTAREDGRWWLIDPAGYRFLSIGVNHLSYTADPIQDTGRVPYREAVAAKYGSSSKWAQAAVGRLREWNFNTIGARSDPVTWRQDMAYTVSLNFARGSGRRNEDAFPDVFSPVFARSVRRLARRVCRPLAHDPWLIGYFTDNELPWRTGAQGTDSLLCEFLRLPDRAPGRLAVLDFLQQRYASIEALNRAWEADYASLQEIGRVPQAGASIPQKDEDDFLRLVAERYFSVTAAAVRAADANHLILGCRFAGSAPRPVLEAMKDHVDVVSLNHYGLHPPVEELRKIASLTGLPVIITEFSFRARDSGLPNTKGEGPILETQKKRAAACERYLRELLTLPMVVGYHWFEYADQPAEGCFDGENNNYGLVNIRDEPYEALVQVMTAVNASACDAAAQSATSPRPVRGE